jgi:serine/threonine protein kinase
MTSTRFCPGIVGDIIMSQPPEGIVVLAENPESLFSILERVGTGGSGCTVYRARNTLTGEIIGIKTVPLSITAEEIEAVKKEIAMLDECNHANVVTYLGTYWTPGMLWVCMEYCAGGSVEKYFPSLGHPVSEQCIAYICHEVLLGLEYLHSQRKIHRDVKGSNVLITENGGVKLADFGVSAQLMNTLSRRNSSVGTLHWMSPEAIQEKDYDERADIWSLGITVIEMAEGEPPHFELHQMRTIFTIPRSPPPTLRDSAAWTPNMHKFLARCLVKDPANRPSAKDLLHDPFILEAQNKAAELVALRSIAQQHQRQRDENAPEEAGPDLAHDAASDDSSGPDETLIHRPEAKQPVVPVPASVLTNGTLVDLPVVNLDDMALDELTANDNDLDVSPLDSMLASTDELAPLPYVTHTTQVLLRCMQYHRTIGQQRGLTDDERRRSEALFTRYNFIVRSSLGV